jgi:hypothetical protein
MWAAEAWQADGRARQEAAAGWKWSRRPSMSFMAALKKIPPDAVRLRCLILWLVYIFFACIILVVVDEQL